MQKSHKDKEGLGYQSTKCSNQKGKGKEEKVEAEKKPEDTNKA